jgi:uncharacterized cupin superfamily protein
MKKINISKIPVREYKSPKRRFGILYQDTSRKLGRRGVPFELALIKVKPGKANFPYQLHTAEHEMYVIVSGAGQMRLPSGKQTIRAGDVMLCPPNEPHQIINTGKKDLVYYVIADNQRGDACYYPDSRKWAVGGKIVKGQSVPYHHGEE